LTVSETVFECVNVPLLPVIVSVNVPRVVLPFVLIVSVELPGAFTGFGLKLALLLPGKPDTLKVTGLPPPVMFTVTDPLRGCVIVSEDGETEIPKSDAAPCTWTDTVVECGPAEALLPVIVTVKS